MLQNTSAEFVQKQLGPRKKNDKCTRIKKDMRRYEPKWSEKRKCRGYGRVWKLSFKLDLREDMLKLGAWNCHNYRCPDSKGKTRAARLGYSAGTLFRILSHSAAARRVHEDVAGGCGPIRARLRGRRLARLAARTEVEGGRRSSTSCKPWDSSSKRPERSAGGNG